MYVRDAKNREEVWLLDRLEEFGFEDLAFRSRDYVLAIDEETGEKTGFGRLRVHRTDGVEVCEVANLGVLEEWRGQGVGAQILKQLIENAQDEGFQVVYGLSPVTSYLEQFGFERIEKSDLPGPLQERFETILERNQNAEPLVTAVDSFAIPRDLRKRSGKDQEDSTDEQSEDFGIDPESATYKYDVND